MIKDKKDKDQGLPRPGSDSQVGAGPLAELLVYMSGLAPGKKIDDKTLGEPPEIEYFQKTWERLSTGLRLQQARQQVPENAGPLNSTQLIHRALISMQEISPSYLQHFLSYVETLSWMEQLEASTSTSPAKTVAKAAASASPKPKVAGKTASKTASKSISKSASKSATKTASKNGI